MSLHLFPERRRLDAHLVSPFAYRDPASLKTGLEEASGETKMSGGENGKENIGDHPILAELLPTLFPCKKALWYLTYCICSIDLHYFEGTGANIIFRKCTDNENRNRFEL